MIDNKKARAIALFVTQGFDSPNINIEIAHAKACAYHYIKECWKQKVSKFLSYSLISKTLYMFMSFLDRFIP